MWLSSSNKTECPHRGTAWDIHMGMGTDSSAVLKVSSTSIPGSTTLLTTAHAGEVGWRHPSQPDPALHLALLERQHTDQGNAWPGKAQGHFLPLCDKPCHSPSHGPVWKAAPIKTLKDGVLTGNGPAYAHIVKDLLACTGQRELELFHWFLHPSCSTLPKSSIPLCVITWH